MTAVDPAGLRAVSLLLDGDTDGLLDGAGLPDLALLALAGSAGSLFAADHRLLAGFGTAAVLPLPGGLADGAAVAATGAWLSTVDVGGDDPVGADGPAGRVLAMGALPFDRSAAAALVVPALTIGQDRGGRPWATLVAPADQARPSVLRAKVAEILERAREVRQLAAEAPAGPRPALTEVPPGPGYAAAVAAAVADIDAARLDKVVLARSVEARFPQPLDVGRVVQRLRTQEPSCTTFSVPAFPDGPGAPGGPDGRPGTGRFVGASPELLVRRAGRAVACHPLAGTIGLTGDPVVDAATVDRFLASAKEHREHRLVVDAIAAVLGPLTTVLRVPPEPSLVRLQSVAHFGTVIDGTLDGGRVPSVLQLLAALHPTPAVGGVPLDRALAAIARLEPAPRGLWAGPVGWVDGTGDGEWMIGLRSATVDGPLIRLHAGAGIVAGSDPAAELAETTVKLAPMLEALAPGASAAL